MVISIPNTLQHMMYNVHCTHTRLYATWSMNSIYSWLLMWKLNQNNNIVSNAYVRGDTEKLLDSTR